VVGRARQAGRGGGSLTRYGPWVAVHLTEADVARLLTPADAVVAVEDSFRRLAAGEIENVPRYRVRLDGGALAVMSAVDRGRGLACVKTYTATGEGASFVVVLFEGGETKAVIEADVLGRLRTGAASAVAAKYLARPNARTLGVVGCGTQARTQVACIREALPGIERVVAYCRSTDRLDEFCREVGAEPGESHRDPAAQDVVVTITTSRDPVLRGEWLQPGALVCAAGANRPQARELDNAVLERAAFVCCDSLADAKLESGDLIEPVEQGVLDWLEVHELQEVIAGDLPGRQADEDIVVFKSTGIAAWDLAVAARVVELAAG
jgi:alanine dehydrogenase